ncbi:sigma 54-interacting transcriptional regulator [Pelosinus baikalensis]|uniref:Sigma 54-interacting transcriptional regulator n=1 Tax=Pelosinus baikalensis TaxID=2892015 RepID=A0ABS8HVE2_9FIRM|nr:sigma 54-interacting transcriptional regulator [Pelosinus baikalensis]MCC5466601.1 sigma 54-interacting transcriptional regulator [Pelosinus baikalensis]
MMNHNYTILVVDDEDSVRKLLTAVLKREGYHVESAVDGQDAIEKCATVKPHAILMDIRMPVMDGIAAFKEMKKIHRGVTVILMTAFAAVETAIEAIKLGAFDYLIKPFDIDEVTLLVNRAIQIQRMENEITVLHRELNDSYRLDKILTNSPKVEELYRIIDRVAQSNASVLITGESGTGKELIANTIHYNSPRRKGPFIKINCSALPEGLLESELFGHEKGAFTGAMMRRAGRFEQADKGTLFLDEIGEISTKLQVKLLRVLQERELERVGGNATIKIDIRVIAATNQNLEKMVKEGRFRQDLYYRMNVVCLNSVPLRERKEDIRLLADHFLHKFSYENDRGILRFDDGAMAALEKYDWPGNVRELANVAERAVIMSTGSVIFIEDLPLALRDKSVISQNETEKDRYTGHTLKEMIKEEECKLIKQALLRNQGNKMKTAKELGISRRALIYKTQEYEIE